MRQAAITRNTTETRITLSLAADCQVKCNGL